MRSALPLRSSSSLRLLHPLSSGRVVQMERISTLLYLPFALYDLVFLFFL